MTTDYFYDNEGKPYKIVVTNNTTSYEGYYVLNQQGDVTAILDAYGNVAVSYDYNAWGRILSESGSSTIQSMYLQSYNHLKYRGYYQDAETGFYYVSSRYYDPGIGRFISADTSDVLTVSPTSFTDKNLYAYCDNNPVVRIDSKGAAWETVFDIASLAASITDVVANPTDPWAWAGLAGDIIDVAIPFVGGVGEGAKIAGKFASSTEVEILLDGMKELAGTTRQKLLAVTQNVQLRNIVDQLYRNGANIRDGGYW